jgi:hypothetical protein
LQGVSLESLTFPTPTFTKMDFPNFDFNTLDQATRDETLALLSYPLGQDVDWDSFHPINPTDDAWEQTHLRQANWQQAEANAYAPNEPQGAL